jgi:hypothetical protein
MVEVPAEGSPGVTRGGSEAPDRFLPLILTAKDGHENTRMTKVRGDLDAGDRDETDARILNLALDDLTELDAKLFFNSIDSSSVHGLYDFNVALDHALGRHPFSLFGCLLQHFLQKAFVGSDCHHTHLRPLPEVLMIDFRNRNVEFRS